MGGFSNERLEGALREYAAEFFERESNRSSLLTVTRAMLDKSGRHATIYFTVFPETMEAPALSFAKRARGELRDYIGKKLSHRNMPSIEVEIDNGEKYRQHLDELSKE